MACKAKLLLAGVDTLILNAKQVTSQGAIQKRQVLLPAIEEPLKEWQDMAKENKHPFVTSWIHEGQTLLMYPTGASGWRWLLKNGLVDLMIGALLNNSALVRVRFSSEYLWKHGVEVAVRGVHAFLKETFQNMLYLQVAEIHLCADVMGLEIPNNYRRVFVSRARVERPIHESHLDKPIYRNHVLETLQFSGHGNPLSATIYDKPKEIKQHSQEKTWFYDLWKEQGWDERSSVWRVECRMKRECLHEMNIEDAYTAIEKIPALWAYCVGHTGKKDGWLRMVYPNNQDENRWRWRTSDMWLVVQQAFSQGWRGYDDMSDIQRERKREVNLDRAEAAIAGYTATYAAWLQQELGPDDDVSVVLGRLYEKMTERWERLGVDFQDLRRKKQFDYHLV